MSPAHRARLRWPRFPFALMAGMLAAPVMCAADPVSPDGIAGVAVTGASGSVLCLLAMVLIGAACRERDIRTALDPAAPPATLPATLPQPQPQDAA